MVVLSKFLEGSSSLSIKDYKYDVFLSFRGFDTRYGFTDHLLSALLDADITAFLDNEEIETAEDLKPESEIAIKTSRASVIVLSKNYASSPWCLDELVLILQQHMTSNHYVLPIFYHVEPNLIRKQQGSFGDAMARYKHMMEAEIDESKKSQLRLKIDGWIQALTEVANLNGRIINDRFRPETELIKEVLEDIYHRLRISSRSPLPQLFGMDSSMKFVTSWLKNASLDKADVLTILGMGGIGKTFLAKHVYGLHSHEFDASSFIEDISQRCETFNGLLYLQNQLYNDISESSLVQVHDSSIYTSVIDSTVAHKKVFLVLDDIDRIYQLNVLLGSGYFHPGSKIIITTREASLAEGYALFKTKVKPTHVNLLLHGLHEASSRKLLCFHAFMCNDPKAGYEKVLEKLVKYCEGHPLALKVLGMSLRDREVAYWEEFLEGLQNENEAPTINVLRKSFDSLPYNNDKELFKHIACFFVGMDRDVAETILNACHIETKSGFTNLVDRCLLSIGRKNKLEMHQLLQEMGKFIVREESPNKPWKRSRLWRHEESFEVLKQNKGTKNVLGLRLDMKKLGKSHETFELEIDALRKMDNLMLLQLNFVQQINGSYKNFPEELRWLCMHGFPLKSVPSDLQMENLVALDLSCSKIKSFGICYSNPERPEKRKKLHESSSENKRLLGSLKVLNLSSSKKLRSLGGFDGLPALERLIVTNCIRLVEVCDSIKQCFELVLVDLSYCIKLEKLPRTVGMLHNVQTLLLDGCNLGEFQVDNNDMDSLNKEASSSIIRKGIPSDSKFFTFSLPRSLVTLSLANNNLPVESFPMDFSGLSVLRELYLYGYNLGKSQGEPEMFKANNISRNTKPSSSAIQKAFSSDSDYFAVLLPESLVRLSLNKNNLSTESFPIDFSCLSMLKELYLDDNPFVTLPNSVKSLPKLEILSMSNCQMLTSVEHPPHTLRELILYYDSKPLLRKVVFEPKMSPVKLSVNLRLFKPVSLEIEGMVKIQPMVDVQDEVLHSLGWTNILSEVPEESEIQLYYEFGIFSTIYVDKEMPNWITSRSEGLSISFTIPSSSNNLRGLNFCSVHAFLSRKKFFELPVIAIKNMTKNCTWLYKHCIGDVIVGGECLVLLSHWMFGKNELESGDHITITVIANSGITKECGVSLVYDDGKTDAEEDVLGYYKSWNHIIGGDLSVYQAKTGVYLLKTHLFELPVYEVETYYGEYVTEAPAIK